MLKLTNPRLRRSNVVMNSFCSCVSYVGKESVPAPKISSFKIVPKPGIFGQKFKGSITFKQLKRFVNPNYWWQFNKQVDIVHSNVKSINFESFPVIQLFDKELISHLQPIKLEETFGIFNFSEKMESILSKAMFSEFQIHFLFPKSVRKKVYVNFTFSSEGLVSSPSHINYSIELNVGDGDSSPNLKVWVSRRGCNESRIC